MNILDKNFDIPADILEKLWFDELWNELERCKKKAELLEFALKENFENHFIACSACKVYNETGTTLNFLEKSEIFDFLIFREVQHMDCTHECQSVYGEYKLWQFDEEQYAERVSEEKSKGGGKWIKR